MAHELVGFLLDRVSAKSWQLYIGRRSPIDNQPQFTKLTYIKDIDTLCLYCGDSLTFESPTRAVCVRCNTPHLLDDD